MLAGMEEAENVLEAIYEDDSTDDADDVEMLDVEEGEFVEQAPPLADSRSGGGGSGIDLECQEGNLKRSENKKKRKRNRKKKNGSGPKAVDINRFVLDSCRRLKEKKSYMVYTAVGCLGVSALSDLIKEVDAIQACGGQMTADGRRTRTGGGILWNIVKTREPAAYREIMKKAKEFEKQFKQQNFKKAPAENTQSFSQGSASAMTDVMSAQTGGKHLTSQNHQNQPAADGKRKPVHERIRVPVSYDDLLAEDPKTDPV